MVMIFIFYLTHISPGKLTENMFSFTAGTWGIVTGERGNNDLGYSYRREEEGQQPGE